MKFTDRIRDYGLTLDEDVIICDRSVVDKSADMIDELEMALKRTTAVAVSYFSGVDTSWEIQAKDALAKLEKLNRD